MNRKRIDVPLIPRNLNDFILFHKESGFNGYEGFQNLIALLQWDAKAALIEHSVNYSDNLFQIKSRNQKYNKLYEVLEDYGADWPGFVNSEYCILSTNEVLAINYIRIYRNVKRASKNSKLSVSLLNKRFASALRKLGRSSHRERFLMYLNSKGSQEPFRVRIVKAPIYHLIRYLPRNIVLTLGKYGRTLEESLKNTKSEELLQCSRFGKKSLETLNEFLKAHDLCHLLNYRFSRTMNYYEKR